MGPLGEGDKPAARWAFLLMKKLKSSRAASPKLDTDRLADFVLFAHRSCIMDLSTELNRGNVSFQQFFLLSYLASEEYLSMSDIAKKMGHSTAAATGLVDRMEKLGYVERYHAAEDRRKILVRITDAGIALVASMRKKLSSSLANVLAEMDAEETENLEHAKRVPRVL